MREIGEGTFPDQMRFAPDLVHHSIPGGSNRLEEARTARQKTADAESAPPSYGGQAEGRALHKKEEPKTHPEQISATSDQR